MAYFFTDDHCRIYYEVHLAEKYRLVFADLRGHGNSDAPAWGYSNQRFADDIRDLVHFLDLKDVWLCGWSSGASFALEYFALHGDDGGRIKGIIYDEMSVKPAVGPDGVNMSLYGNTTYEGALAYFYSLLEEGMNSAFHTDGDVEGPMPAFFKYDDKCGEYKRLMATVDPSNPAVVCLLNVALLALDQREVLPKVDIPFLMIEGSMHVVYPQEAYDYVAEHVPNCKRVIFEGAGHALHMEFSEEFNRVVDAFIQGEELPAVEPCVH